MNVRSPQRATEALQIDSARNARGTTAEGNQRASANHMIALVSVEGSVVGEGDDQHVTVSN